MLLQNKPKQHRDKAENSPSTKLYFLTLIYLGDILLLHPWCCIPFREGEKHTFNTQTNTNVHKN